MTIEEMRFKLVRAVTAYDRAQANKRGYNRYALGQYLARVDDIETDLRAGAPLRSAVVAALCGRLLNVCLKAVGEPVASKDEQTKRSGRRGPRRPLV